MAFFRRDLALALAGLWLLAGRAGSHAQTPATTPTASPSPKPALTEPELANVRKAVEALTPEQRKRLMQNLVRWAELPAVDKKALRERDELRRKRMTEEITGALQKVDLNLVPQQRTQFVKRYAEERKKIEEQLRKESEEKRRPMVAAMLERLKVEFAAPPTAVNTAVPATPVPTGAP